MEPFFLCFHIAHVNTNLHRQIVVIHGQYLITVYILILQNYGWCWLWLPDKIPGTW